MKWIPLSLTISLLMIATLHIQTASSNGVVFNVVYGGIYTESQYLQVEIVDVNQPSPLTVNLTTENNITFTYQYQTETLLNQTNIKYRYTLYNVTATLQEAFYRSLGDCRVATIVEGNIWVLKNEYFNQSQLYLGLDVLPNINNNANGDPPTYYDDNQVMTLSFSVTSDDLEILFDPNSDGDTYVKTNLSFVSLTSYQYLPSIKIRRAGGISLTRYPYSYQVKMNNDANLGGIDRVFKLKAYPKDYEKKGADIIAEKTAADISYAVGAPVNYVSFVRVFINNVNQGVYGMLEKIDENFVERRWPYQQTDLPVGTLYKAGGRFDLVDDSGWNPNTQQFLATQSSNSPICCPCYAADCPVTDPDCRDPLGDPQCGSLSCCSCSWESNGDLQLVTSDCTTQKPFDDFFPLGDAIVEKDPFLINTWLNAYAYAMSIIAEMTVMNADGYVYSHRNYYWYRDSVKGTFDLILYDQDACFSRGDVANSKLGIYNWTYEANLADGLFLPTLMNDTTLYNAYTDVLTNLVLYYYRSDNTGSLYQRMNTMANYLAKYNPGRIEVADKVYSFINYFILPLSSYLREELSISSLPPVNPTQTSTCDV